MVQNALRISYMIQIPYWTITYFIKSLRRNPMSESRTLELNYPLCQYDVFLLIIIQVTDLLWCSAGCMLCKLLLHLLFDLCLKRGKKKRMLSYFSPIDYYISEKQNRQTSKQI